MPEQGILRTIRLGSTYHTIYLSPHYHGTDYEPYLAPDEVGLRAFLHTVGIAKEEIAQHCVVLQQKHAHTLVHVLSDEQVHACFPAVRRYPVVTLVSHSAADGQGNRR